MLQSTEATTAVYKAVRHQSHAWRQQWTGGVCMYTHQRQPKADQSAITCRMTDLPSVGESVQVAF